MRNLIIILSLFVATIAHAQTLTPVLSGLSSPVFVGNAGDGSNRLFIVEQAGIIKVRSTSGGVSTLLDIRSRVLSGGERGLLGLAFHPTNKSRFFVYYTRQSDGTIVIAEYGTATGITERVLLTIPHPGESNHNGGMLAFGPDGSLYAGVGDGGGANDPNNNAQNPSRLLGKILRINVDTRAVEIYAIGMRNPWRFSFDRSTGQLWCGDVGQDNREEVDIITRGGNYGWRIREGTACSGNDPSLCNQSGLIGPITEYTHSGGRCSITGGFVYRGNQNTFPAGAYIFGDYCSGEIFQYRGSQSLLMDTSLNITSFGEDEAGEIYVVGQGGTLHRLTTASTAPPVVSPPPVTTPPVGTLTAPSNLKAVVASSNQVNLTWQDNSSGEDRFLIERARDGFPWAQIATVGTGVTNFPSTGLSAGTTYWFRVRAGKGTSLSTYSNAVVVGTPAAGTTPPPVPSPGPITSPGPVTGGSSGRYVPPSRRH